MPTAQQLQRAGRRLLLAALLASLAGCRAQPEAVPIASGSTTPRLDAMKQHALSALATMESDTRAAVAACGAFLTANEHTALACAQEAESISDSAAECPEICAILLSGMPADCQAAVSVLLPKVMHVQPGPTFELLNQVCGTVLSKSSTMPALPAGSLGGSSSGGSATSNGSSRAAARGWACLAAGAALATCLALV